MNFTDEDSRIMPVPGGGFEQAYNAQAAVDTDSMLVVPAPLPAKATPMAAMRHRLQTRRGRKWYALRKCTVEPVFGLIKHVIKFRQFLLRGLANAHGEWSLVCLAWNMKRMNTLRA